MNSMEVIEEASIFNNRNPKLETFHNSIVKNTKWWSIIKKAL